MEVTPTSRKGTLGTWWFRCSTWQSDAEPTISLTCETGLSFGQTTEVGAYADQRLNLAKLGRLKEERPRLRTGPEKLGRPGLSGGLGKRGHGGNVNPPCNRKGEAGNPPPTTGALEFYPNRANRQVAAKANRSEASKTLPPRESEGGGSWKCRDHLHSGRRPASSVKELGESNRWTSRGLGGRHVEKVCQQKHGSAPGSPRRREMTHSEDSAYKPPCGEIGLCLGVGRMGPVK